MNKTEFYLVRHGKKEKGFGDVPISSEGILEAQATARFFGGISFDKIVSSPLQRAKDTAMFIALQTNHTISIDQRLRERANWGDIPGQSFEEFVEMWERCTRERDFAPPGIDSARSAGERLSSCLTELAIQHPGARIIIVTHGGLITDFLMNEIPQEALLQKHHNFIGEQSYLIAECSITRVHYVDGVFTLESLASADHLLSKP